MEPPVDPLAPLREALSASPENLPLRRYLADQLCALERFEEAEAQYRDLLHRLPEDDGVRLALAQAYLGQGKTGHADILVELVTGREAPPAQAFVLLARIRIAERDFRGARMAFRAACELQPSLESSDVAGELGVGPSNPFELEEDLADLDLGIEVGEDSASASSSPVQRFSPPICPKETASSAAGFEPEKSRLSLLVTEPLMKPALFSVYGRSTVGGTLLMGPPGAGKSHLLRCLAGESAMRLVSLDAREVLAWDSQNRGSASRDPASRDPASRDPASRDSAERAARHGASEFEARLERFFEAARQASPCVVVVEHLDAIQDLGSTWESGAAPSAATALARCLFEQLAAQRIDRRGVAFVAVVERPLALDPLFASPGRFDRGVILPLPRDTDRRELLQGLLADKPCGSIDLKRVTRKTAGRRVSELVEIVEIATESALERALQSGKPEPIREKALLAAARSVRGTAAAWYDELRAQCEEPSFGASKPGPLAPELQDVLAKALRALDRRA